MRSAWRAVRGASAIAAAALLLGAEARADALPPGTGEPIEARWLARAQLGSSRLVHALVPSRSCLT